MHQSFGHHIPMEKLREYALSFFPIYGTSGRLSLDTLWAI